VQSAVSGWFLVASSRLPAASRWLLTVFRGGAGLGEVGVGVLNARIGLAVRELVGEAVVGFAGTGGIRAGSIGRRVFSGAFASVGVGVSRLGHAG
jgi:hypothetical protein